MNVIGSRMDDCDIQIVSDKEAQQALLRFSLYHLLMLPFFKFIFPALARNPLLYRYHTVDGARCTI